MKGKAYKIYTIYSYFDKNGMRGRGSWMEPLHEAWAWLGLSDSSLKMKDGKVPVSHLSQWDITDKTIAVDNGYPLKNRFFNDDKAFVKH